MHYVCYLLYVSLFYMSVCVVRKCLWTENKWNIFPWRETGGRKLMERFPRKQFSLGKFSRVEGVLLEPYLWYDYDTIIHIYCSYMMRL